MAIGLVSLGRAWWVVAGATGPIDRTRLDAIPPYVLNGLRSDQQPRLLAIDLSAGTARYSVLADGHLRLGDADRGGPFGGSRNAREQVNDLVVRLVAGTADSDIAPHLGRLGIGYVWVTGADEATLSRIDNTPGLGTASGTERGTVWQLNPAVSRRTLEADGADLAVGGTPASVPPGPAGRLLRIGEAADSRWTATLDDQPLTPVTDGWQQAFEVPADAGLVRWSIPVSTGWLLLGQGAVLLVAAVLAAPGVRRPEVRDPTKSARRAATLSELA